jgi:thymidylate kinase
MQRVPRAAASTAIPTVANQYAVPLLRRLDSWLETRVLVFGSLPPTGRDVDLLVQSSHFQALAEWLDSHGFEGHDDRWVRFAEDGVTAVDIVCVERWRLSEAEVDELFHQGVPLPGMRNVLRPSPAHALLILARKEGWRRSLSAKHRAAIEAVVLEDAKAWPRARGHAQEWRAESSLACLRAAWVPGQRRRVGSRTRAIQEALAVRGGGSSVAGALRVMRRAVPFRRGVLVALSGLDGAGKSSQAAALRDNLRTLGYDAVVLWSPLGGNPAVSRLGAWGKQLLNGRLTAERPVASAGPGGRGAMHRSAVPAGPGGMVAAAWVTFVGLTSIRAQARAVLHLLRGRVVICDRYSLDSAVHLRHRYGDTRSVRLQISLISLVSPQPRLHYLLEVPPEVALRRKVDRWSADQLARRSELYLELHQLYGARRVDAGRSQRDLATQIGSDVWHTLR